MGDDWEKKRFFPKAGVRGRGIRSGVHWDTAKKQTPLRASAFEREFSQLISTKSPLTKP